MVDREYDVKIHRRVEMLKNNNSSRSLPMFLFLLSYVSIFPQCPMLLSKLNYLADREIGEDVSPLTPGRKSADMCSFGPCPLGKALSFFFALS